jgi:hypothetical protein
MRRIALAFAALAASWWTGPGCACTRQTIPRGYPTPSVEQLLAHVEQSGQAVRSYNAESTMDYWVGDQRIKATVLVMGERGAKVFFKALNPATDTAAADLVCNGQGFVYVDYEHSCQLSGQCDRRAIGRLLRVSMEPDDFLLLAIGSVPIIADPSGTVRWDQERGAEVVELVSRDRAWRQTLVLDGRSGAGKWDVLESVVRDGQGAVDWKLQNKDFRPVTTADGRTVRVPGATRFEQPQQKADLQVRWEQRLLNTALNQTAFQREPPALKTCGAKQAPAPAPAPAPARASSAR